MAGSESFFFEKPVGILGEMGNTTNGDYQYPVITEIKMVQNGYELKYENKCYIASTLDEALDMTREWFKMHEKEMTENEKKA